MCCMMSDGHSGFSECEMAAWIALSSRRTSPASWHSAGEMPIWAPVGPQPCCRHLEVIVPLSKIIPHTRTFLLQSLKKKYPFHIRLSAHMWNWNMAISWHKNPQTTCAGSVSSVFRLPKAAHWAKFQFFTSETFTPSLDNSFIRRMINDPRLWFYHE